MKNHFQKSETIETTLAKILDKLAKFSKLNFLGVGCSLDELLERLFLNLGSYFYLVYSIWSKLQFIQCSKFFTNLTENFRH